MNTVILTDEQEAFLLGLLSHDVDMVGMLARDLPLSFDTSEDDMDDVALRDLMSTTCNALMGAPDYVRGHTVHAFHGTRETCAGAFVIDTYRSLDEGPNVLTARCVDPQTPFMGWIFGGDCAKFVEVPPHLADHIADAVEEKLCGYDTDEGEAAGAFVDALRRVKPSRQVQPTPPLPQWRIVNSKGGVEWVGAAADEVDALDRWADSMEMERYSDAQARAFREDAKHGFGLPMFWIDGVLNAIHSNYNVTVEREVPREVLVHLNVAVRPSDTRTADGIATDILEAIGCDDDGNSESVDVAVVNALAEEV